MEIREILQINDY